MKNIWILFMLFGVMVSAQIGTNPSKFKNGIEINGGVLKYSAPFVTSADTVMVTINDTIRKIHVSNLTGTGGSTILNGTIDPTTEGNNGDFYINTTSDVIFGPKTAGVWGSGTSLVGPTGAAGADGTNGTDGTDGSDGNSVLSGSVDPTGGDGVNGDFYINTTDNTIFGPKTAGVWGSGVDLVGPTGPGGTATQWTSGSGVPSNAVGTDGDYYLNNDNGDVYLKSGGVYALETNIAGPANSDAGTLDGIDSSQFLRSDTEDTYSPQTLNIGTNTDSGIRFKSTSNPDQEILVQYEASDGDLLESGYAIQIESADALPQNDAHLEVEGNIYSNGSRVVTLGNDGPGSGVNADLLDGFTSGSFALASTTISASTGLAGGGTLGSNFSFGMISIASGSATVGALRYNGTTRINGMLYGGTTSPVSTNRLNYDGYLYATQLYDNGNRVLTTNDFTSGDYVQTGGTVTTADWNSLTNNQLYVAGSASGANFPSGAYNFGNIIQTEHGTNGSINQMYFPNTTASNGGMWFRTKYSTNAWQGWQRVWTNTTDGAGSGLDADLLDGLSSSSFARLGITNNSNNYLHINRSSTSPTLYVNQTSTGPIARFFKGASSSSTTDANNQVEILNDGSITATGDITAFVSSDRRLKENIHPIDNAMKKINRIGGFTFDWNAKQNRYIGSDVGVMAQDVKRVLPWAVRKRSDGFYQVAYHKIVPLLIEGIKEQNDKIDAQEKRIKALERKLDKIVKALK